MNSTPHYEVKNIKSFTGREGYGFNAALYRDGKKVADVSDMADGGCHEFVWLGMQGTHATMYDPNHPEARILHDHVATLPEVTDTGLPDIDGKPFVYRPDADTFVSGLVDDVLLRRDLARLLKRVAIKLPTDAPGNFRIVGTAALKPTPETLASIARQYPQAIILNSLPFDEALALYRSR